MFSDFRILFWPYSALGPLLSASANQRPLAFFLPNSAATTATPCFFLSSRRISSLSLSLSPLCSPRQTSSIFLFFSPLLSPPSLSSSSSSLSLSLQSDSSRGARVSVSACCVFGSLLSVGFALKAAFLLAAAIIATAVRIHLNRSKSHSSLLLSFGCYNLPFTLG